MFFEISSKKLSETRHGNPYLQQKGAIPKNRQTPWKKGGAASFRGSLFQRHPGTTCPGNAKQGRKEGSRKGKEENRRKHGNEAKGDGLEEEERIPGNYYYRQAYHDTFSPSVHKTSLFFPPLTFSPSSSSPLANPLYSRAFLPPGTEEEREEGSLFCLFASILLPWPCVRTVAAPPSSSSPPSLLRRKVAFHSPSFLARPIFLSSFSSSTRRVFPASQELKEREEKKFTQFPA